MHKKIDIAVPDKKAAKNFTAKQKKWVKDLKRSLVEVDMQLQGKIEIKTVQQLLDEL